MPLQFNPTAASVALHGSKVDGRTVGHGGVADRVKQGIDVLICHPRLVQTGLDLIGFPTICWYETEFYVFQSTEKGTVLMGSRFGYIWG